MDTNQPLYPIREVSRMTGVNSITLRAWERRYGLIEPVRTESGHRLYTDEHIEQVKTAVSLTKQGIPISRVKALLDKPVEMESTVSADKNSNTTMVIDSSHHFLLDPLNALNFSAIEKAIDQLFTDFPEKQAYYTLAQINLLFTQWQMPQKLLWQTIVSMRLQTRLRHQLRMLPKHRAKTVLIVNTGEYKNSVTEDLMKLYFAQQGSLAMVVEQNELKDWQKELPGLVKSFEVETMVVLTIEALTEQQDWVSWSEHYSALDLQVWWLQEEPNALISLVQSQGYCLDSLFTA